jgi:circadian clock protein KaiB
MKPEVFIFRLYVAGKAPNSMQAIANLTNLCDEHLPDRHEIEIVDICVDPGRALDEQIYMTPTLICVSPAPSHRIVGTLTSTEPILQILGLGPANRRAFPALKDRNAAAQAGRPG